MILYCTQLSMPTKITQTECPHKLPTVCVDDMFVTQLSVPSMVAQTVEPQRRPTVCANTGGTDSCTTNTSTTHHKQIVDPRRQQQQTTKTSTANLNYCTLPYSTLIYSTVFYFTSALCYSTVHDCLSVPTKMFQTNCPHRFPTVCVDNILVTQLSVPSMVAQTVGPQRHQQQTTKTSTANIHITADATTAADTTTATLRKSGATSATTNQATFNIHI